MTTPGLLSRSSAAAVNGRNGENELDWRRRHPPRPAILRQYKGLAPTCAKKTSVYLAPKDSNLDKQIQSLSCYHYTRGQSSLKSLVVAPVVSSRAGVRAYDAGCVIRIDRDCRIRIRSVFGMDFQWLNIRKRHRIGSEQLGLVDHLAWSGRARSGKDHPCSREPIVQRLALLPSECRNEYGRRA